ncbi:hypothetical protein V2J09_003302 [Rumex salicifolius]
MGQTCVPLRLLTNNFAFLSSCPRITSQYSNARLPACRCDFKICAKADSKVLRSVQRLSTSELDLLLDSGGSGNDNNSNDGYGGGSGGGGDDHHYDNEGDKENSDLDPLLHWFYSFLQLPSDCIDKISKEKYLRRCVLGVLLLGTWISHGYLNSALAFGNIGGKGEPSMYEEVIWEVRGSRRMKLVPDSSKDQFVVDQSSSQLPSNDQDNHAKIFKSISPNIQNLLSQGKDILTRLMLPEGFPNSVTSDYLEYSLWRGVQGIASQVSGVLATQSLLFAVGLGKGAIPTAAAINWVLKDGIGYLSKIVLSKYGRHFDLNPKGWRLFADLLENAAYGLEIVTPAFPHLFVFIGAIAGAGRSAAALIQAATRSCFYAGFAAKRNFAEVIAKGEAQGMVSKFLGIAIGIAIANYTGSSTPLALAAFSVVTWIHMFCNLKSYQSIQLRNLNPYRASLIFSEYLLSGQVPPVKEVNAEEPLFPAAPFLIMRPSNALQGGVLSVAAKDAAANIDRRLQLGSKLSNITRSKGDAIALFDLYKNESYILTEHNNKFCVILKESATQLDMLKSLFQVNYLYWLEQNAGIKSRSSADDCRIGGKLQISLEYAQREFNHIKNDSEVAGWVADGLIARPASTRISLS